jgi:YD repeat-containing protein
MPGMRFERRAAVRLDRLAIMAMLCALAMGSQAQTYGYDSLGRLVSVTYPNGSRVQYAYDKAGNRVSETVTLPAVRSESVPQGEVRVEAASSAPSAGNAGAGDVLAVAAASR